MIKSIFIALLLIIFSVESNAQTASDLVKSLNKLITLYSNENAEEITLRANIGTLEQKTNVASFQRIKLENIGRIKVEANADGYAVNYACFANTLCINLIKNDMVGTPMPSNAFFFNSLKGANTFAKVLSELILKYPSEEGLAQVELLKDAEGNTPIEAGETPSTILKNENNRKENLLIDTKENEEVSEPKTSKRKPIKEINEEDEEEILDKKKKASETNKLTEKKSRKNKDIHNEDEVVEPIQPDIRRSTPNRNEDAIDNIQGPCKQLLQILNAGKNSRFKEIEGRETNADTKINESKIKIKGAKRNYLSWYKKQRAFIAEYKTSNDNELILIEFDKLQTELEDCLEGGWEDSDHSNDEQYANESKEIKDIEYKNTMDANMPSLRIMMNTDESGKQTIFIRIQ